MTLGCGGWGGNITSDNISPRHLLNIKRLAYELAAVRQWSRSRQTTGEPRSGARRARAQVRSAGAEPPQSLGRPDRRVPGVPGLTEV